MEFPVDDSDRHFVDAGDTPAHQPVGIELPILIAIAAEPGPAIVLIFVTEADRDAVLVPSPKLLDQAVMFSRVHLRLRNASISSWPPKNSTRCRHWLFLL